MNRTADTADAMNGQLKVRDLVLSTRYADLPYLVGRVTKIAKHGTPDHQSGNSTDDVYVDFTTYSYQGRRTREIEGHLSGFYGEKITLAHYPLDMVIMAPENLLCINGIETEKLRTVLSSQAEAAAFAESLIRGEELIPNIKKETIHMVTTDTKTPQGEQTVADNTLPFSMEVNIHSFEPKGNLLGFASIKFNEAITVYDFRIIQGENGLFVGMPSKPDQSSTTGFRNTFFIDKAYLGEFNAAVIGAYQRSQEQSIDRHVKGEPDKLPAKEQMKAASKVAERHHAAVLPKEKKSPAHAGRE